MSKTTVVVKICKPNSNMTFEVEKDRSVITFSCAAAEGISLDVFHTADFGKYLTADFGELIVLG